MVIAIPSKGRAGKVRSLKVVPSAFLFVPEYEEKDYLRAGYKNVVPVPKQVKGITATRNWILKSVKDRHVVFVDDDLKRCGWYELFSHHAKQRKLTNHQWLDEFQKLFQVTEGLKLRLWGVATDGALQSVYPYKPFLWKTYVTASCCGVINDGKTYFDESFPVKEDYELCLRCIKEDGAIVGARHLFWQNFHWTDDGGCMDYRTQEMELDCIKRLQLMYPGMIRKITRGGSEYSIALN